MLNYSFSTVLMAILASNLLLVLITLFFLNKKIMVNIGYKLLALFIVLTVLRFLLPFELPFTSTVSLAEYKLLSSVIAWIRHPLFTIWNIEVSVWFIFELIWLVGFIINFIKYVREHMKARYYILANSLDVTSSDPYASLLQQICAERKRKNVFQVLTVSGINNPMLYGVFSPRILLPEGMELSQEELYYTLTHEISHHFHHDLLIKKLVRLIFMVYWWNPLCYVLISKMDILLEMRVDGKITASGKEAVLKYLHCLINIGERSLEMEQNALSQTVTLSFLSGDGALTQRYYMMVSAGQKKNHVLNIALFALVFGIYALSHLYIVEADYASTEMVGASIDQTASDIYAVLKEDGTYDIYYRGMFMEHVESLEFYSSDIPIYTEKELTNEEN